MTSMISSGVASISVEPSVCSAMPTPRYQVCSLVAIPGTFRVHVLRRTLVIVARYRRSHETKDGSWQWRAVRLTRWTLLALASITALVQTTANPRFAWAHVPNSSAVRGQTADWRMLGFDVHHTGYNPYETILDTTNVGKLEQAWRSNTNGP